MLSQVDLLAFGFRPGDVECGAGGLIAKEARFGYRVGVVDFCRGEGPPDGADEDWRKEAQAAAAVLGIAWRQNLDLTGTRGNTGNDLLAVTVRMIREARPRLLLVPWQEGREPERPGAAAVVSHACQAAGLKKYLPELRPHAPSGIIYYFTSRAADPSFIVEVTPVYEVKRNAMAIYRSRFAPGRAADPGGSAARMPLIEARDRYFGSLIGKSFGEGYMIRGPLAVPDPLYFFGGGQ
ncbi:MAG: PIG-L family deacetylase [Firmicutes bacterium]|nr:PIG-L family deacetylase [Bacillota bacterium]